MALDKKPKAAVTAEERQDIFFETYGDELDAGRSLGVIVLAAGRLLRQILPVEDADAGMARMLGDFLPRHDAEGRQFELPRQWAEALEDSGFHECYSEWPMGEVLHDLTAYALYGIVLHGGDTAEREAHLDRLIEQAEYLHARVPTQLWTQDDGIGHLKEFDVLMTLVQGRQALDRLEPITPAALAWFGNLSEGRVRNLMSGKGRTFNAEDGLIPAHEALAWLEERDSYYPSIWREHHLTGHAPAQESDMLPQVWFVPVARDGSVFSPGLQRGGSYAIGAKGSEEHVEEFEDALRVLQQMKTPYWRRPNAAGHWGIVRGVRWARLGAPELKRFADSRDLRLAATEGEG